jgi:hypothetical protein
MRRNSAMVKGNTQKAAASDVYSSLARGTGVWALKNARPTNQRGSGAVVNFHCQGRSERTTSSGRDFRSLVRATLLLRAACLLLQTGPPGKLPGPLSDRPSQAEKLTISSRPPSGPFPWIHLIQRHLQCVCSGMWVQSEPSQPRRSSRCPNPVPAVVVISTCPWATRAYLSTAIGRALVARCAGLGRHVRHSCRHVSPTGSGYLASVNRLGSRRGC